MFPYPFNCSVKTVCREIGGKQKIIHYWRYHQNRNSLEKQPNKTLMSKGFSTENVFLDSALHSQAEKIYIVAPPEWDRSFPQKVTRSRSEFSSYDTESGKTTIHFVPFPGTQHGSPGDEMSWFYGRGECPWSSAWHCDSTITLLRFSRSLFNTDSEGNVFFVALKVGRERKKFNFTVHCCINAEF